MFGAHFLRHQKAAHMKDSANTILTALLVLAGLAALLAPFGLMFEYSLNTITGKNVPFWLDIIGGLVSNGIGVIVFVICLICNYAGIPSPWIS